MGYFSTVLLLLVSLSFNLSAAVPINERSSEDSLKNNLTIFRPPSIPFVKFWQKLDHFNASKTSVNTWVQHYWTNAQWWVPGGPVFVMLGAEEEVDPKYIEEDDFEWTRMAKENQAWCILIEHRFYGNSKPELDMTTDHLAYLTIEQAMEDYVAIIKNLIQYNSQLENVKWIVFGGSYGGSFAVWLRTMHPELVYGAVASSGPIQAKVDFSEYLEVVQTAITNFSPSCGASVTAGFNQVADLLKTAQGRQSLKLTFNLCQNLDPNDAKSIMLFWETIYTPYMQIAQNGGDAINTAFHSKLTIDNGICRYHNKNSSSVMARMQAVNNYFEQQTFHIGCNDVSYDNYVGALKDTSYGKHHDARSWMWQKCTELGYFPTTNSPTAGPWFGGIGNLPLSFFIDRCNDVFGTGRFTADSVAKSIATTNARYGGLNFNATHVLLPNGTQDPWHAIGKVTSTDPSVIPVIINGTAHCADMYFITGDDSGPLNDARQFISDTVTGWLAEK